MKYLLTALALSLLVITPALADFIGIFADQEASVCELDLEIGLQSAYIMAVLPTLGEGGITAAEFAIEGLPSGDDPLVGSWTVEFTSDLIIGDLESGLAIAWTEPQTGSTVEIGRIDFTMLDHSWVGDDHVIKAVPTPWMENLNLVDHEFITYPVLGTGMTFNCTVPENCECGEPGCSVVPNNLDFDEVGVGAEAEEWVTIYNEGNAPLSCYIELDDPNFTVIAGGGAFTIPAGGNSEVLVRFAPTDLGPHSAMIETGAELCDDIYCSGTGVTFCSVTPGSEIDLGLVPLGVETVVEFTIHNHASNPDYLSGNVTESCPEFELQGSHSYSIPPGGSYTCRVRFEPLAAGQRACTIDLGQQSCPSVEILGEAWLDTASHVGTEHIGVYSHPNAAGCEDEFHSNYNRTIYVCAIVPEATDGITAAKFRLFNLPRPNGYSTVNVSWLGDATVSGDIWDGVRLDYASPRTGVIVPLALITLHSAAYAWVGDDHEITATQTLGEHKLVLADAESVERDVLGSTFTFNCGGTCDCGVFDTPVAAVEPTELDYGCVMVGEMEFRSFIITNTGGGLVEGRAVIENAGPFEIYAGDEEFSLAHGETWNVDVSFQPEEIGEAYCVVETGWDEVLLMGVGDGDPFCVVEPDSLYFGTIQVDSYVDLNLEVRNEGGGLVEGEVALASEHFFIVAGGGPFALGPLESHDVMLRFSPTEVGAHAGVLMLGAALCVESVPLAGHARPAEAGLDYIGLFAEEGGELCLLDLETGAPETIHVAARVPFLGEEGILGAMYFRIEGLPAIGAGGSWSETWYPELVQGDAESGLVMLFENVQVGDVVELGHIDIEQYTAGWVGDDHLLAVVASDGSDAPRIMDHTGDGWPVPGGTLTLNCTSPNDCACLHEFDPVCEVEPPSIDFGTVYVGEDRYEDILITNSGGGLVSGNVAVSGIGFSITEGAGGFSLANGESHAATIMFLPTNSGGFYGHVTLGSDECEDVPLYGFGFLTTGPSYAFIGIFADEDYMTCYQDVMPYVPITLYMTAYLHDEVDAITAAEFRVDNWHGNPGYPIGITTITWATPLVIGSIDWGVALAFDEPVPGPFAYLGSIEVLAFDDTWIGVDYMMEVMESNDSGFLGVVDTDFNMIATGGGRFTFNCSDPVFCECYPIDVPVALASFELEASPGAVRIDWRADVMGVPEFKLEAEMAGETWSPNYREELPGIYTAHDESPRLIDGGDVSYMLSVREDGGDWQILTVENITVPAAELHTALLPGHPNPFNPRITLPFSLSKRQRARLAIYDVSGRLVTKLVDEILPRGAHEALWLGRDDAGRELSSGVYFARLETARGSERQKLVLLR